MNEDDDAFNFMLSSIMVSSSILCSNFLLLLLFYGKTRDDNVSLLFKIDDNPNTKY